MGEKVLVEKKSEQITLLTLNRPEAANAPSLQMLDELNCCLDELQHDSKLNCLIITGSGEKAFCAGADLKERRNMDDHEVKQTVRKIGDTFNKLESMPMPTIAAINGAAFGGGLELALACDLRIISRNSKVGLTETGLAIIPGAGGTQRLPRLIGAGKAKRMIFEAKPISAEIACELGIAEEEADADKLMEIVCSTAEKIACNGPLALRLAKRAINSGVQMTLEEGLALEYELYMKTLHTEDRIEGLKAFQEKRKPFYNGK